MGVSDAGELHDGNPPPCSRLLCMTQPPATKHIEGGKGSNSAAAAAAWAEQGTASCSVPMCPCVLTF